MLAGEFFTHKRYVKYTNIITSKMKRYTNRKKKFTTVLLKWLNEIAEFTLNDKKKKTKFRTSVRIFSSLSTYVRSNLMH